jgi:hypothetical protein
VLEVREPSLPGEADRAPCQVEQAPRAAGVLGDRDKQSVRSKDHVARRVDLGHRCQVWLTTLVTDVGPAVGVVEAVGVTESPPRAPGGLVDDSGVARVRRHNHEIDGARQLPEQRRETAGVSPSDPSQRPLLRRYRLLPRLRRGTT